MADLAAVVDAAGLDRFTLLGMSQGAAAVAYAAAHPQRVADLLLYGGYARGRRSRRQEEEEAALVAAIRAGWTSADSTFRHVFSMLFLPQGTPEQMAWYDDLLRTSTTAETRRGCSKRAAGSTSGIWHLRCERAPWWSMRATTGSCRSRRAGCSPP